MLNYKSKLNNAPFCKEVTTSHFVLYFDTIVCCNVMRTQGSTYQLYIKMHLNAKGSTYPLQLLHQHMQIFIPLRGRSYFTCQHSDKKVLSFFTILHKGIHIIMANTPDFDPAALAALSYSETYKTEQPFRWLMNNIDITSRASKDHIVQDGFNLVQSLINMHTNDTEGFKKYLNIFNKILATATSRSGLRVCYSLP